MGNRRVAVVMAGGSGERFWPLSRKLRPKQLLNLADRDLSLIEQTVGRLEPLFGTENVWIATAPHLVEPTVQALPNLPKSNILAEPHKRNTAGCLVWVAASLLAQDPGARSNTSMAIVAADHRIGPDAKFQETVSAALSCAEETGALVTIGIKPDRPETGYGYVEIHQEAEPFMSAPVQVRRVKQFREKPSEDLAKQFLASGGFLWNSGTFYWTLDAFMTELEFAAPELAASINPLASMLAKGEDERAAELFGSLTSISIDYALMEKARNVFVAQATFDWDDVGAWDALERSFEPDSDGNVMIGESIGVETLRSIVSNNTTGQTVCLLGVEDLVVVATEDAILVCPKNRAQEVRKIVDRLNSEGISKT